MKPLILLFTSLALLRGNAHAFEATATVVVACLYRKPSIAQRNNVETKRSKLFSQHHNSMVC